MPRVYRYLLLDVFTETALAGNQLAVFPEAEGLSDSEMQQLARETNLSETTFCFPRDGADSVPVRIFTIEEELPFAGHPTLGTATALRMTVPALRDQEEVRLRLSAGTVPVRFSPARQPVQQTAAPGADGLCFAAPVHGVMDQPLPGFGKLHQPEAVAQALGLPLQALDAARPIQTVSTGIPFVIVVLASIEALTHLRIDRQAAERYLRASDGKFFYVLAANSADGSGWRARMQFYGGEDPATGSAAGCATAYLVRHGLATEAAPLLIEQGAEVHRPSSMHCSALLRNAAGSAAAGDAIGDTNYSRDSYVRVGGSTVLVAEGRFFLS